MTNIFRLEKIKTVIFKSKKFSKKRRLKDSGTEGAADAEVEGERKRVLQIKAQQLSWYLDGQISILSEALSDLDAFVNKDS